MDTGSCAAGAGIETVPVRLDSDNLTSCVALRHRTPAGEDPPGSASAPLLDSSALGDRRSGRPNLESQCPLQIDWRLHGDHASAPAVARERYPAYADSRARSLGVAAPLPPSEALFRHELALMEGLSAMEGADCKPISEPDT